MRFSSAILAWAIMMSATALPPELKFKFEKEILPECRGRFNVNEYTLTAFRLGYIPPTRNNKCFVKCCMEKLGVMTENGTLIAEDFIRDMREVDPYVAIIFDKCTGYSHIKSNPCDTANAISSCVHTVL